ncbi:MAG: DUF1330 domain-containing protein [Proteobacteria bacterium]|nr:DUF1330 domain-containing protein [Pseudomonadota bacterium]
MSAYLIVDIDVHDHDAYETYRSKVPGIIDRFGGEYIVRGGAPENTEGDWSSERIVVLRFPDRKAARQSLASEDYAPIKAIRHASATSRGLLVDGF